MFALHGFRFYLGLHMRHFLYIPVISHIDDHSMMQISPQTPNTLRRNSRELPLVIPLPQPSSSSIQPFYRSVCSMPQESSVVVMPVPRPCFVRSSRSFKTMSRPRPPAVRAIPPHPPVVDPQQPDRPKRMTYGTTSTTESSNRLSSTGQRSADHIPSAWAMPSRSSSLR